MSGIKKPAYWVGNVNIDPKMLNKSSRPYLPPKGFTGKTIKLKRNTIHIDDFLTDRQVRILSNGLWGKCACRGYGIEDTCHILFGSTAIG